jgi:hypothetical protein
MSVIEPSIGAYALGIPSGQDVLSAMIGMFGEANGREKVDALCARAGLRYHENLSLDEVSRLADELNQEPGLTRVVGLSLKIRLSTYRQLKSRQTAPGVSL